MSSPALPGSDASAPLRLPYRMHGRWQRLWAFAFIAMGIGAIFPWGIRQEQLLGADIPSIVRQGLWLWLTGLVLIALAVRLWLCSLVVNEAGVVVTNVFRRYRIPWTDLHGVDVESTSTEDVDQSQLRFYRGSDRRPLVASATQRPGINNAELTSLAAGLMALRERACSPADSFVQDAPDRPDAMDGGAKSPESDAAPGQPPPSKRAVPPNWLIVVGAFLALAVVLALELGPVIAEGTGDHFPVPGNCAKVDESKEMHLIRVPCTNDDAQLRVTSRHDNTSDIEAACAGDPAAKTGYAFTEEQGDNAPPIDLVLCVAPK